VTIEPIKGFRNEEQALCKCDDCCAEITVSAAHGTNKGGRSDWKKHLVLSKPGQVIEKIQSEGWAMVKNKLRCPKCEAARKSQNVKPEVAPMKANITALRKPTPAQKRQIVEMLMVSYDTDKGRYRGHDTDKTVADAIGGVMLGWVSEIREDMFGPAGGNDEMEKLTADMNLWMQEFNTDFEAYQKRMNERFEKKSAEYLKRIEAIKKAVGPKAASA